jgi:hypothetical protein
MLHYDMMNVGAKIFACSWHRPENIRISFYDRRYNGGHGAHYGQNFERLCAPLSPDFFHGLRFYSLLSVHLSSILLLTTILTLSSFFCLTTTILSSLYLHPLVFCLSGFCWLISTLAFRQISSCFHLLCLLFSASHGAHDRIAIRPTK